MTIPSLDLTYEELKLTNKKHERMVNMRLDLTYEELKLKATLDSGTSRTFRSYLWGIETHAKAGGH